MNPMSLPDPLCLNVVLCDQIIEDKRTGKKSLIGVFNEIHVTHLPAVHGCMFLLVTLTNCLGAHEINIGISRDTEYDAEIIMNIHGQIQGRNPVDIIDLVFELRGLPLAQDGKYQIDVTSMRTGQHLSQRSFFVRQVNLTSPPAGNP